MSKKSRPRPNLLLTIFLIVFPFVFQIVFREFNPLIEDGVSYAIWVEFLSLALLTVVFGRLYCGALCQVGATQRAITLIRNRVFKKRLEIPESADRYMRWLKYIILAILIISSIVSFRLLINPDFPLDQFEIAFPILFILTPILAVLMIVGGLLFDNFFCKYLCVQGAINATMGKFSIVRIKKDEKTCAGCKLCTKRCPANLEVHAMDTVKSMECLYCQNCMIACPKKNTLNFYIANKKVAYPVLLILSVVSYYIIVMCLSLLLNSILA